MRRMFSLKQLQEIADSEIKKLVEGGTLANAKPIYWHGLEFAANNQSVLIYAHILNNDSTAFTKDTLQSWFQNVAPISESVYLQAHGLYTLNNVTYKILSIFRYKTSTTVQFTYDKGDGTYDFSTFDFSVIDELNDGVNKIN